MNRSNRHLDPLEELNPVPETHDPTWAETETAQRLFAEIESRATVDPRSLTSSGPLRNRRFRTTALLVGAVVALGGAGAYALINDDRVTFEEYEYAYTNVVGCMREEGLTVEGPLQFGRDPEAVLALELGWGDPTIQLGANVADTTGDLDWQRADEIEGACRTRYMGDIERRWLEQHTYSPTREERRAWIDSVVDCAERSGINIPSDLSYEEMLNDVGTDPSDQAIMEIAMRAISSHGCTPWEPTG